MSPARPQPSPATPQITPRHHRHPYRSRWPEPTARRVRYPHPASQRRILTLTRPPHAIPYGGPRAATRPLPPATTANVCCPCPGPPSPPSRTGPRRTCCSGHCRAVPDTLTDPAPTPHLALRPIRADWDPRRLFPRSGPPCRPPHGKMSPARPQPSPATSLPATPTGLAGPNRLRAASATPDRPPSAAHCSNPNPATPRHPARRAPRRNPATAASHYRQRLLPLPLPAIPVIPHGPAPHLLLRPLPRRPRHPDRPGPYAAPRTPAHPRRLFPRSAPPCRPPHGKTFPARPRRTFL